MRYVLRRGLTVVDEVSELPGHQHKKKGTKAEALRPWGGIGISSESSL